MNKKVNISKKYKLFFALLSLLPLFFGCSSNNDSSNITPKVTDDLSAEILTIVTSSNVPAIAAAAVSSEGLQAIGAAGIRKVGDETKVTINDKFQLGSCGKALTATLMGIIINEGYTINGQTLS